MALRVCEYCGKAWIDGGENKPAPLCPRCAEELNGIYMLAWSYLRDSTAEFGRHRKISAQQLASELGIDVKAIDMLVKMGKIQTEAAADDKTPEERERDLETLRKLRKGLRRSSRHDRRGR